MASPKTPQIGEASSAGGPAAFFASKRGRLASTYHPVEFLQSEEAYMIQLPKLSALNVPVGGLDQFDDAQHLFDENPIDKLSSGPFRAHSKWTDIEGKTSWVECIVMDYSVATKKFTIKWVGKESSNLTK